MSIKVNAVSKVYGTQRALDQVSFEIQPGQIVGLLGPNGAGKSTMMKILTCFIPPTSGEASINNFDVMDNSIEVRRIVGYLPENNPLYLEMYVKEYLRFIAGIYHLDNITQKVDEMIALTGLELEVKKKIGELSKGYRQRVGLAQALIHNPQVLILDEPTSGLDPNQLVEIRNLIRKIGREKTIMLSTHIMQEVEAICDRVIIIHKGRIVADDSTENLHKLKGKEESLIIEFDSGVKIAALKALGNIKKIEPAGINTFKIVTTGTRDVRPDLFQFAIDRKLTVLSLQKQEQSLEEIFRLLTKN
nr:gliding motility-associated ABC transporter ATP-binding subunit GldA [Bacteroidota bacterium]